MPTEKLFECSDGTHIAGDYFAADTPHAMVIIAPAMGVPRGFYRRFAIFLATCGIGAITFDYRDAPGTPMADWGRLDIEAVISSCDDDIPLFLVGHSCGGQLAGLAPHAGSLDGLIFIAAQSGYWGHWGERGRAGMWLLAHALIPLLARGRYFPARRLRMFPIDVPASVVAQWGRWIRSPRYLFDPANNLDTRRYRELALPALAYGFADDGYAPPAAIDALLDEYPQASITARRHIGRDDAGGQGIGHMGFFRDRMQDFLWQPTVDWILDTVQQRDAG